MRLQGVPNPSCQTWIKRNTVREWHIEPEENEKNKRRQEIMDRWDDDGGINVTMDDAMMVVEGRDEDV